MAERAEDQAAERAEQEAAELAAHERQLDAERAQQLSVEQAKREAAERAEEQAAARLEELANDRAEQLAAARLEELAHERAAERASAQAALRASEQRSAVLSAQLDASIRAPSPVARRPSPAPSRPRPHILHRSVSEDDPPTSSQSSTDTSVLSARLARVESLLERMVRKEEVAVAQNEEVLRLLKLVAVQTQTAEQQEEQHPVMRRPLETEEELFELCGQLEDRRFRDKMVGIIYISLQISIIILNYNTLYF